MPCYYFHLAFELSRHSLNNTEPVAPVDPFDCYIPPQNLNLFGAELPIHRSSTWASYIAPKKEHRKSRTSAGSLRREARSSLGPKNWRGAHQSAAYIEALPVRESGLIPLHSTITRKRSPSQCLEKAERDWRFEKISVESIDMDSEAMTMGRATADQHMEPGSTTIPLGSGSTLTGKYTPSNPRSTEFGWGVVHLYRDCEESAELSDSNYKSESSSSDLEEINEDVAYVDKECTTLCILAVPSYMTPSDLLGWLGEDTREAVSHFRLIRTGRSNKFMVLMKFRDAKTTRNWQREWNGKLFNSLEPENCHVVFVKSIRFQAPDADRDPSSFPDMSNDPFTPTGKQNISNPTQPNTASADTSSRPNTALSAKPAPPPTPSLVELPTCPVCLERMDETTGLATIFCQHVFHCACLQKWRGSGCPVCRYTQSDPSHGAIGTGAEESDCRVCGPTLNPWICLLCGYVGCGRYEEAHAFAHYEDTGHSFAMDIATQHVWDYAGDAYVHRLIQNKSDGKLVELPSAMAGTAATYEINDKEKMSLEYMHMLTSQMESQRLYFEQQVHRGADKLSQASADAESANAKFAKATAELHALRASHDQMKQEALPALERDKERAARRAERFEGVARKMEKEWREKEVINDSLMDRIAYLEKQLQEAAVRNSDLEEQNRDLSFFISGMEKLKDAGEEVREGVVGVVDGEEGQGGRRKKKPGRKR